MIKFIKSNRIKEYWRQVMDSTKRKMPCGSQFIARMIPFARHDNWRRQDKQQRTHPDMKNSRHH